MSRCLPEGRVDSHGRNSRSEIKVHCASHILAHVPFGLFSVQEELPYRPYKKEGLYEAHCHPSSCSSSSSSPPPTIFNGGKKSFQESHSLFARLTSSLFEDCSAFAD